MGFDGRDLVEEHVVATMMVLFGDSAVAEQYDNLMKLFDLLLRVVLEVVWIAIVEESPKRLLVACSTGELETRSSKEATWAWRLAVRTDETSSRRRSACYLSKVRAKNSRELWAETRTFWPAASV